VTDFSHRDRRAHREIDRAFWTIVALALGLTAFALEVPTPLGAIAAVVALVVVGGVYLGWSDRLLASYANDLRDALEDRSTDGFLRAEVASPVGLDRPRGRPTAPSPHVRRRSPGTWTNEDDASLARPGSGQL